MIRVMPMDPLSVAAGGAQVVDVATRGIRAAVGSSVEPGRRRRQLNRSERQGSYLRFQQAALTQLSWTVYVPALSEAVPSPLMQMLHMRAVLTQLGTARADHAEFGGALLEIRMIGNPGPRAVAEEIASLVGELYARVPRTRRPKGIRAKEEERFAECMRALGDALRRFTLAARADLGNGPRWWQRHGPTWWRRRHGTWPGGWPGPDALELIESANLGRRSPIDGSARPAD